MMAFDRPLVSLIVPSLNQGRFIGETLQSCLAQSYRPIEILVMDGGSTDQTLSVLHSIQAPELRWWSEPDEGVVAAVNEGLARARGAILSIQSSDDVYLPGAVADAVEVFLRDPRVGLVFGDVELIDAHSRVTGADRQGPFDLALYVGRLMYVPQPGAFFSRAALEAVGGWRAEYSYAADADLWLRIALHFPVRKLSRVMGRYRYHPHQRDRHRTLIRRDWESAVRNLISSGALDARTRRYARSGIFLARHRYADQTDWWGRTRAAYAALLVNPGALAHADFPKRDLLPGREPIFRALSRAKRSLGLRPRGS